MRCKARFICFFHFISMCSQIAAMMICKAFYKHVLIGSEVVIWEAEGTRRPQPGFQSCSEQGAMSLHDGTQRRQHRRERCFNMTARPPGEVAFALDRAPYKKLFSYNYKVESINQHRVMFSLFYKIQLDVALLTKNQFLMSYVLCTISFLMKYLN